jgi:hypothetical protein
MHLSDGELRAYLDHEMDSPERERVKAHLAACTRCGQQMEALRTRSAQVNERLAALAPSPKQASGSLGAARARLNAYISEKENTSMIKKLFSRKYRTAWVGLAAIAILAVALAFPPVQAIANSFLGLFRVQQFNVVQVNPGNLPEQLGSSSQFEAMLSNNVQFEKGGEAVPVSSAEEAGQQAGFSVRLPTNVEGSQTLKVQPGGKATFNVNMEHVRALLAEIGRSDIALPENLDGSSVTLEVATGVEAQYGECSFDAEAAREAGYDPDNGPTPRLSNCTTLMQMPSPTISAPPGLDINKIGEAYLQVMGMTPEEAAQFAQNVDWTTTLVVPIHAMGPHTGKYPSMASMPP